MTMHLRVVKGAPDADELAAVTAVITTLLRTTAGPQTANTRRRAHWDRAFRPHASPASWCHRQVPQGSRTF
ncbi:acyl-CoA carboxylase subunit epsilon [Streptomyces sp. NPDC002952]|uniref:acyl-CoA carboxylase subunit epsilon n=1 Tax=Streptomyces sp. NPDC002952 TaxID=3364673 RepID=UPI003699BA2B